jgi:hypothetical protein
MKKQNIIAIVAAAVLLAACIPSVNPFYTDKDVIFDGQLLGRWQEKGNTNAPEIWTFEKSGDKAFKLTVLEQGKTGEFEAHLFKIKNEQFLDLTPSRCEFGASQADLIAYSMFPGHLLVRVPQIDTELKLSFFNFDWLYTYLTNHPGALAHHFEKLGAEDSRIVLTADTRDLQKFVLKHLGTNELFKDEGEMVRISNENQSTNSAK